MKYMHLLGSGEMSSVHLQSHTPNPIQLIFTAIRTCYSPNEQDYVFNEEYAQYLNKPSEKYGDDAMRLINDIVKLEHWSTLEHVTFNFFVSGVSRSLLAQLTRHRIGWSYSVQSQRYVRMSSNSKHGQFDYVIPPKALAASEAHKAYIDAMEQIQQAYDKLISLKLISEDARYVLPNAATTNITVSCNLRSFLDFYKKRGPDGHAQWEIQELAEAMKAEILEVDPRFEMIFNVWK